MKSNEDRKISNRKAYYDYEIIKSYRAGIVLSGKEVKTIRLSGNVSMSMSYCFFDNTELWIKNFYVNANEGNDSLNIQDRKLLLHRKELNSLKEEVDMKGRGMTIVPLEIIAPHKGYIKVIIGLCRGKHKYEKRALIKEKEFSKEIRHYYE